MINKHPSRTIILSEYIPKAFELEHMRASTGDDSQRPLIVDEHDDDTTTHSGVTKREAHRLIWLLTLSAGLSGLLFGYE